MAGLGRVLQDDSDREAHEYLASECPWFKHVLEEGSATDPAAHCRPGSGSDSARLSAVLLTPRTPEASTVVKPTVPPGGPGLFHMKGHHLPPYMEHLWFHLVKRYGKHDAYRVANGIVHKWAKGINPGGWKTKSGKGKRVHADVQAAAARNIAEWEKERAEAHARHGSHGSVRATAPGQDGSWPSPAEVRALIPAVPDCTDVALSNSARTFLETAAGKLEKDDGQGALSALRSAQSSVYAASKADLIAQPFVTPGGPGTASVTDPRPPADPGAARALASRERQAGWRRLAVQVAALAARLHGRGGHPDQFVPGPALRFTGPYPRRDGGPMTALDKILALSSQPAPPQQQEDPAGELVLAASSAASELFALLASDADNDGDDDSSGKDGGPGDTDDDAGHVNHPLFKKLKARGVPDAQAAKMCARADKQVKATQLAEAVVIALAGLDRPGRDWVEATAYDARGALALAGDPKRPYGDVTYADPGYQPDGKKRYPLDNETHVRAGWSYIHQGDNAGKYSSSQLAGIKAKIKAALSRLGISAGDGADKSEKVAATMLALAARREEALQAMHHAPFTGRHSHGHMHQVVSGEEHFHNGDNDHSRHGDASDAGPAW